MVVTHDQAVAARMRRQVQVLDGRIISDTGGGRPARPALAHQGRGELS
jgi:ABC-type lipoprotein export system ATPase subunit